MNTDTNTPGASPSFPILLNRFAYTLVSWRYNAGWGLSDRLESLRWQLVDDACSAAHEWIARQPDPLAMLAELRTLRVGSWPVELRRFALSAVNRQIHRARREVSDDDMPLRVTVQEIECEAEPGKIVARCDAIRLRVRALLAAAERKEQSRRVRLRRFLHLLEDAEAFALAVASSRQQPLTRPIAYYQTHGMTWNGPWNVCAAVRAKALAKQMRALMREIEGMTPEAAREAIAARFRERLSRFIAYALQSWTIRAKVGITPSMEETAMGAALIWLGEQPDQDEAMTALAESSYGHWPKDLARRVRRAVRVERMAARRARTQITEESARMCVAAAFPPTVAAA